MSEDGRKDNKTHLVLVLDWRFNVVGASVYFKPNPQIHALI